MIRGLKEYLEAPLMAVLDFCDGIDSLAKRRTALLLDYDHHKRKHEAFEVGRRGPGGGGMGGGPGGGYGRCASWRYDWAALHGLRGVPFSVIFFMLACGEDGF